MIEKTNKSSAYVIRNGKKRYIAREEQKMMKIEQNEKES
jgi:hypothetical protein